MLDQNETKDKEKRALWIGIGTIVAVLCLAIGLFSLIFGGQDNSQRVGKKLKPAKEEKVAPASDEKAGNTAKEENKKEETNKPAIPGAETYEVQPGDTLYEIGLKYDIDWRRIAEVNQLAEDVVLRPGDKLIIPAK